jgi:putative addiction module component (TIGR02574 family)
MSTQQLREEVMALSREERLALAEDIYSSLDEHHAYTLDADWMEELARRDKEMDEGTVPVYTHEEVMQRLRQARRCE